MGEIYFALSYLFEQRGLGKTLDNASNIHGKPSTDVLEITSFLFLFYFIYLPLVPTFRLLFPPLRRYHLLILPDLRWTKFFLRSWQFSIKSTNFLNFLNPWIHWGIQNSLLSVPILSQMDPFHSLIFLRAILILSSHPRVFFRAVSGFHVFPLQLHMVFLSLPHVSCATTIFFSCMFFLFLCLKFFLIFFHLLYVFILMHHQHLPPFFLVLSLWLFAFPFYYFSDIFNLLLSSFALRYKPTGRGFDSRWCLSNLSVTYSFRSHYVCGVDSASNRNEYQVYSLGGKGGRRVWLTTLPPFCADVMKTGNLNFLEPSGPLLACHETALTFTSHLSHSLGYYF